jgi:hypothetical protein
MAWCDTALAPFAPPDGGPRRAEMHATLSFAHLAAAAYPVLEGRGELLPSHLKQEHE